MLHYSKEKFGRFNEDKKLRVILEFIEIIAANWDSIAVRIPLIENFRQCLDSINRHNYIPISVIRQISHKLPAISNADQFLFLTKSIWHNHGNDYNEVFSGQKDGSRLSPTEPMPLCVVLDNLRSAFNVGSIIRTGECFNITKIYFCGYTPTPDNEKVKKTAMGTEDKISWVYHQDVKDAISELKTNYTIIALETGVKARFIHQSVITFPAALILGNEALGVSEHALTFADSIVKIPVRGWKNSFNVATAFGIACYEVFRQWDQ